MQPWEVDFIGSISNDIEDVKPRLAPLIVKLEQEIRDRYDRPIIGIGHSLGGVLMFFVAKKEPQLFERVIFLDPPIFRPSKLLLVGTVGKIGLGNIVPVAKLAANRRNEFSSIEEAEAYFASKSLFKRTHPATAHHYAKHALMQAAGGYRLLISPAFERAVFLNLPISLGKKTLEIPSHFFYASRHDVLSKRDIFWLKENFTSTSFSPIEGSHMFPLEKPEVLANEIKNWIVGS